MKRADFESLITKWQNEQVISIEQADYMRTDVRNTTSEVSGTNFVTAISLTGAAVLTAGVLLLIASNWSSLGKPLQLILALLLPIIPIGFAYYMSEVKGREGVLVRAAGAIGVGLIGGSLSLIGQIYNLETGYTTLTWMWALLSLPFVFVFRRTENVGVSALLIGFALFVMVTETLDSDERALTITMTVLALAYAGLLYGLGSLLRHSAMWGAGARVLRLFAAAISSTVLFITTFEFYARFVTDASYRSADVTWVPVSIVLNLVFIAFMVFVLMKAYRYQEERLAFSVLRLMFLYLIVKYFTLFSDMFETGLLLVVGGVLFISGAVTLERNKQYLLSLMRSEDQPSGPTSIPPVPPSQPARYE